MTSDRLWGKRFDCVVMLTWSNWKSESRSNRYHFATRFARKVPVLFVQPDEGAADEEPTEIEGMSLLHVGVRYHPAQLGRVREALTARGLSRPLVWIYNPKFERLESYFGGDVKVYHATEDYFSVPGYFKEPPGPERFDLRNWRLDLQRRLILGLRAVDLVVCVTQGVANGIRKSCGYGGPILVLENGCDYAFWNAGREPEKKPDARKVAIYQGGINERIDASLMMNVMNLLPDWEFQFCGPVSPTYEAWQMLRQQKNLRFLGRLDPESLRDALYAADVGLMPFVQDPIITRQSLPLKAFEYAACGLPVVSVAIESLARHSKVFRFAATAREFAKAIVEESGKRRNPEMRAARNEAARAQDYDLRFDELTQCLDTLRPSWHYWAPGAWMRAQLLAIAVWWNNRRKWAHLARRKS